MRGSSRVWEGRACGLVVGLWVLTAPLPADSADAWERWSAHDPESSVVIDHSAWDELLDAYVVASPDGVHRVRYAAWQRTGRGPLERYLERLEEVAVSELRREEQFALWVNLYNALTVRVVLDHYPVDSIRDIDLTWFRDGPWSRKLARIAGEELSLDDIEHRILRPLWRDPRVHYAVNCASLGCPNLQREAFRGDLLDDQLERAAREFVSHPRGLHLDEEREELVASKIYRWFDSDFGETEEALRRHLLRYVAPELAEVLRAKKPIDRYRYDWSLNDATAATGETPTP